MNDPEGDEVTSEERSLFWCATGYVNSPEFAAKLREMGRLPTED